MAGRLWTVPSWTTLRVAHTAHSPDGGDEVGTFSTVKWVLFQLSRFRLNGSSGSFFDCQMGTFSLDKNNSSQKPGFWTENVTFRDAETYKKHEFHHSRRKTWFLQKGL